MMMYVGRMNKIILAGMAVAVHAVGLQGDDDYGGGHSQQCSLDLTQLQGIVGKYRFYILQNIF